MAQINDKAYAKFLNIMIWASFYRANMFLFVKDYLHVDLKLFQKIIITAMDNNMFFMFWASRG